MAGPYTKSRRKASGVIRWLGLALSLGCVALQLDVVAAENGLQHDAKLARRIQDHNRHILQSTTPAPTGLTLTSSSNNGPARPLAVTSRADPLNGLKKYTGGFDPTNKHYWGSVVWLGIWGYVIGVFWFLVGILWLIATCCYFCCCRNKGNKGSGYPRGYYCCPAILVVLLSCLALAGSALTFYGESQFARDSTDTKDYVLLVAANTTANVRNVTGTLQQSQTVISQVSPSDGQDLQSVIDSLNQAANQVDSQVHSNKSAVDTGITVIDIVLIVVAACQIAIVFVGLLALWFKWSFLLVPIIVLGWLFCVFGWIVAGVWYSVYFVATDACTAMAQYNQDPANTTLQSILPCVNQAAANRTLLSARHSIDSLVNATNAQIATLNAQLAAGGSTTVLPTVCLPYGSAPTYPDIPCPSGQVAPVNLQTAVQAYRCPATDTNGCALAGTPLTPALYTQVEPVILAITNISQEMPLMVELATCQFVKDAFTHLLTEECPHIKKDVLYILVAFTIASSALLLLCIGWFVASRRALRVKRTDKYHTEGYEMKDQYGQPVGQFAPPAPNQVSRV